MNKINRTISLIKHFGLSYTLCYILKKINLIDEIPIKLLIKRQNYYKNLSLEKQKKELCESYKSSVKHECNIDDPKTWTEKIQYLKFYDSTKLKAKLSDKYLAPKLIREKYGERINIIPQLGVWDKAQDIDFDALPEKFVLKCNHGSAMNIIVKNKSKLNIKKTIKKLNDWLKVDYAYVNGMYENHYTYIERKIIAEQFIEEMDGNLHDYKFHCFMGEPQYIEFIGDRVANTHKVHVATYSKSWIKQDIHMNNDIPYDDELAKPEKLDEMLNLARQMAEDFPYVRVDFYYIDNKIYFGELTFTPESGFVVFNNDKLDLEWGSMIRFN